MSLKIVDQETQQELAELGMEAKARRSPEQIRACSDCRFFTYRSRVVDGKLRDFTEPWCNAQRSFTYNKHRTLNIDADCEFWDPNEAYKQLRSAGPSLGNVVLVAMVIVVTLWIMWMASRPADPFRHF